MNQFQELFNPISIWVVDSDQFNIVPPVQQANDDADPLERIHTPVYFVEQKFVLPNEFEPVYHVYSDLLGLKTLHRDKDLSYLFAKIVIIILCNEGQ